MGSSIEDFAEDIGRYDYYYDDDSFGRDIAEGATTGFLTFLANLVSRFELYCGLTPGYIFGDDSTQIVPYPSGRDRYYETGIVTPHDFYLSADLGARIVIRIWRLSFNISPATGNLVVVTEESLRETYGNNIDQAVRAEFGAQLKMDINYAYKIFKISSSLTLFSNYLYNPQNIQVYWDIDASLALTKVLTLTARTNLIYDDNIQIEDRFGVAAPRVQFKEIVSLGLTWTFGQYIKGE